MTVDISKALGIKGWMSEQELIWLAQQATTHNFIVEVGCYAGRSSWALAMNTNGQLVSVDNFLGSGSEYPLSKEDSCKLYTEYLSNMQEFIKTFKASVIHPDDINKAKVQSLVPDMVFIDGDHSYEAVSNDIKFWSARLSKGGLLCGHDSGYPPIQKALSELVPGVILEPGTTIWYKEKE